MELGMLFDLGQDSMIWDGLTVLSVLPIWLLSASNPDRIREALTQIIPQFAKGQLLLEHCEIDHIRYKNDHWTGFYHLVTSLPGDNFRHILDYEGEIYPPGTIKAGATTVNDGPDTEGWQAIIPELNLKLRVKESEKVLATLAFLTDPELSRQYLTRSIRSGSKQYRDLDIKASHPNVVRYKPGSRATIIYQLEYGQNSTAAQHWPQRVVAKTYRGVKGKNAFDSMTALWNSALRTSGKVNVAEPLAYDEQERVMIQGAIAEEKTLKSFLQSVLREPTPKTMESLFAILQKTAAGLAELHRCEIDLGKTWDWEDEIAEIRERVDSLSVAYPALVQAVEPLLERLNRLAAAYPADPAVSSHGSFRPSQVLISQDQIGFIDFDAFCQSEPANDLALFLSTMMVNILMNRDVDEEQDNDGDPGVEAQVVETREARFTQAIALRDQFLNAYEQVHPVSRQRVALWETLDILMLVLHYWIKVKPVELKEILYLLQQQLEANHFIRER